MAYPASALAPMKDVPVAVATCGCDQSSPNREAI